MDARAIRLGLLLAGTVAVAAALGRHADPGQVRSICAGHVILLAGAGCGKDEIPSRVP